MARTQAKVQTASFVGGLNTEASPLTFPENSCLDIDNLNIDINGTISRRSGLMLEEDYQEMGFTYNPEHSYDSFVWKNAGGRSDVNLVVLKVGYVLYFYRDIDPISDNPLLYFNGSDWIHSAIDLFNRRADPSVTQSQISELSVQFATGKGKLYVVGSLIEPLEIKYNHEALDFLISYLSASVINMQERDFDGVSDSELVSARPSSLTEAHKYNLLNQGWDSEKIEAFYVSQQVYPSNADIWSSGRDANNNFSPAEMVKLNFGNSQAPKGKTIFSSFNNSIYTGVELPTLINTSIVYHSSFTGFGWGWTQYDITTSTAHELSEEDYVTLTETLDNQGFDIDGTWQVKSILSSTVYRVRVFDKSLDSNNVVNHGKTLPTKVDRPEPYFTYDRPRAIAFYAGRLFYSGVEDPNLADKVYFSQMVLGENQAGKCYQDADPTSDEISDLVDTDGGIISIAGMGIVTKMMPIQRSLLVFSTNGVWEISGEGDNFFRATGYGVRKITSISCRSPDSVVEVGGSIFFFSEDGIYVIQEDNITGLLNAENISDNSVKTLFQSIDKNTRRKVLGLYHEDEKKVYWLYNNSSIVFDLRISAYYKYSFNIASGKSILGLFLSNNISPLGNKLRFWTKISDTHHSFSEMADRSFEDWGESFDSMLITGHATLGDLGVKKQAKSLILHFLRTETGVEEDLEENLHFINPSSCKVRAAWDWTDDIESNKWTPEFQGYRYRQLYTASGPTDTFNTGYEVITTKTKLRGNGRALSLQFKSEAGKDMKLLGWAIDMDVANAQ